MAFIPPDVAQQLTISLYIIVAAAAASNFLYILTGCALTAFELPISDLNMGHSLSFRWRFYSYNKK